jgi:hypothetical protein
LLGRFLAVTRVVRLSRDNAPCQPADKHAGKGRSGQEHTRFAASETTYLVEKVARLAAFQPFSSRSRMSGGLVDDIRPDARTVGFRAHVVQLVGKGVQALCRLLLPLAGLFGELLTALVQEVSRLPARLFGHSSGLITHGVHHLFAAFYRGTADLLCLVFGDLWC